MLATSLRRMWTHIPARRRRQFALLLALMLVSAVAEVVSLGAVLPFLAVLTAPDRVYQYPLAADIARFLGITRPDELVLPLTLTFVALAMLAGGVRLLVLWLSTRLSYAAGADVSIEVYRRTLYQPYPVHVSRNSSEVIAGIISKVGAAIGVVHHAMLLMSSVILMVFIMIALLAINPVIAATAAAGFGASYVVVAFLSRRRLQRNSYRIAHEQNQVVKALQEGLGGIREILLGGTQRFYTEVYKSADLPLRRAQGTNQFLGQAPRFIMEVLGMVLIAALAYLMSLQTGGMASALPMLGALALGAQRLLPALQQSYVAWANIAGSEAALADVVTFLEQKLAPGADASPLKPLSFSRTIQFHGVRFRYHPAGPWVLDGIDLSIPKGARVGFVGSTGSGKSTTLDLVMGLLDPTEGRITVDGHDLGGAIRRSWQRSIAHVPQAIFLADSTFAQNIAFGVSLSAIDMDRVRWASQRAQIASFIESTPAGFDTVVGERGVRLSGGQRQRIGIARALYKDARVLIFDEATNALDSITEEAVMAALDGLQNDLTVLLIAHRISTIQNCDLIVEFAHGRVAGQGRYTDLLQRSPTFRNLARAGGLVA